MNEETEQGKGLSVHSCVCIASVLLQQDEVTDALENPDAPPDADTERTIAQLVRCANLVLSEIAADYLPLKTRETVAATDGRIGYDALQKKAIDIFAVRQRGKSVPFTLYYDCLRLAAEGDCEVEYSYAPNVLPLNGFADYTNERLGARTVAYGIACEYCLISGMTDDALVWDKRYKDALAAATRPKNERRVKSRVWR